MLYPIKFEPIIKEKIWGGSKLKTLLNKQIKSNKAGESWEVSGVKDNLSVVSNGFLKGKNIQELIIEYKELFVGYNVYKKFKSSFPLLIKFIDAKDDLSVQVHPDDIVAKNRHNESGKNEMWYIIDSEEDSYLILGVNKDLSKEEYVDLVEKKRINEVLNKIKVQKDDVAFIPAGRIHAIMKGVFLAEIQQSSDITYRIYDWDRPGLDGSFRDLHTKETVDIVELKKQDQYLIEYDKKSKNNTELCKNKFFTVNSKKIIKKETYKYQSIDSFIILMTLAGEYTVNFKDTSIKMIKGETVLIPACIEEIEIEPSLDSILLEVYI